MFNQEQRLVYDRVMRSIPTGGYYFLDKKAGKEKTFLVNAIYNRIRGVGHIACIIGLTTLSVTFYKKGRTAHSIFSIPVQKNTSDLQSIISIYSGRAEILRHAALIMWKEFPIANKAAIECVEYLLRQTIKNEFPFSGKTFLALNDFRQVTSIFRYITVPAVVFDSSIRSFSLWKHFHVLRLTRPVRNAANPVYAE